MFGRRDPKLENCRAAAWRNDGRQAAAGRGDKELRVLLARRDEERACSVKKCAAATKIDAAESRPHCLKYKCDAADDVVTNVGDLRGRRRWRAPHSTREVWTDQAGRCPEGDTRQAAPK
jgi:hypothetical protein